MAIKLAKTIFGANVLTKFAFLTTKRKAKAKSFRIVLPRHHRIS